MSKKLDYFKAKTFFIIDKKGNVSYKFKLPKNTKIHLIFHILILELANSEMPIQDIFYYHI